MLDSCSGGSHDPIGLSGVARQRVEPSRMA